VVGAGGVEEREKGDDGSYNSLRGGAMAVQREESQPSSVHSCIPCIFKSGVDERITSPGPSPSEQSEIRCC
jgi:hypothetical protein